MWAVILSTGFHADMNFRIQHKGLDLNEGIIHNMFMVFPSG